MANIDFPADPFSPIDYRTTTFDDSDVGATGKLWRVDTKGRWYNYVETTPGGGASTFAELTDKVTADMTVNTSIADGLAGKQPTLVSGTTLKTVNGSSLLGAGNLSVSSELFSGPVTSSGGVSAIADGALSIAKTSGLQAALDTKLATATAAGTYAPISTTVTTSGEQPVNGTKTFSSLVTSGTVVFGSGTTFFSDTAAAASARSALGLGALSTVTPGTNVATALAVNADATGGIFRQGQALSATTITASGAVTCGSEGTSNTLTVGNQTAVSSSAKIRINGRSGGGTLLHGEWVMRSNAYFSLDTYGATDAIKVDAGNGRVAFTRGMEGDTYYNGRLGIGTTTPASEDAGLFVVDKGFGTTTGNHHAIRVKSTDSVLAAGAGVNFFDSQAIISSPNNIDHVAEFQARSNKTGSGSMNDWFGYWTAPIFGGGSTTRAAHVHIEDGTGAGTVATQYGLRIKPLTKGATNYAIVTEGTAPCVFGGNVAGASYKEGVTALGTVVSTATITISGGSSVTATLTASTACTFTMPAAASGLSFIIHLKQAAATGSGTATFTGVVWAGGIAPTITATAGKMDILSFVSGPDAAGTGQVWYGSALQNLTPP